MYWAIFWAIFSQIHLVTLLIAKITYVQSEMKWSGLANSVDVFA
jgi:hypothetical protein